MALPGAYTVQGDTMGFFDRLGNLGKGAGIVAGKKAGAAAGGLRDAVGSLFTEGEEPAEESSDDRRAALRVEEARLRAEAAALRARSSPKPAVEPSPAPKRPEEPVSGTGRPIKKTL